MRWGGMGSGRAELLLLLVVTLAAGRGDTEQAEPLKNFCSIFPDEVCWIVKRAREGAVEYEYASAL